MKKQTNMARKYSKLILEMNDKDALQDLVYKMNNEVGIHWVNEDKLAFIQKIKEFYVRYINEFEEQEIKK